MRNKSILMIFSVLVFALKLAASPLGTTYQARIIKPDGQPLEATSVNYKFSVLDPEGICILYAETFSAINMADTTGLISFTLGSGIKIFPVSSTTFAQVFDNSTPALACDASGPPSYSPQSTDVRKVVMQFNDGNGWQTMPALAINAVPYAIYAGDSLRLGGVSATSYVRYSTLPTCVASQALQYNGSSFSCVTLASGSSSATVTSGDITTALGFTPANQSLVTNLSASMAAISTAFITSFNGSASSTQIFAIDDAGNAPSFVTANGVHTLNIPMASVVTTTAGLISNSDYVNFSNKITSSAASIAQVLGYMPASATSLGSYLTEANNLSDLTDVIAARNNLGLGGFATISFLDLGSASATGILSIARLPSFNGDVTSTATSNTLVLANTGVTPGTYSKVSVDSKGRVISSSALIAGDVITALGYAPVSASAASQWITSGTTINYNLGNVGIGTGAPEATLQVNGTFANRAAPGSNLAASFLNSDFIGGVQGSGMQILTGAASGNTYSALQAFQNGYNTFAGLILNPQGGNVGVGLTAPTAKLHLASGTVTTASLKFTSGALLASPADGAIEYDGANLYYTDSTNTRRTLASANGSQSNSANNSYTGVNTFTGATYLSNSSSSINSSTGALVVSGGVGIGGTINISGSANVSGSAVIDGSLKLSAMTSGSILFAAANGTIAQDNSNFFWNNASKRLGMGTTNPKSKLDLGSNYDDPIGLSNGYPNKITLWSGGVSNFYGFGVRTNYLDYFSQGGHKFHTGYFGVSGTESFTISATGNIGIGTANPSSKLQVSGGIIRSDLGTSGTAFVTTGTGSNFQIIHDGSLNVGILNSGGGIQFRDTTGTINNFTILPSGNVGIGTSTPLDSLDVFPGRIRFGNDNTTPTDGAGYIYKQSAGTTISGYQAILETGPAGTRSQRLVVDFRGNVGIGITAPTAKLNIAAGTSSTAPMKFTSGTLLTTPQSGTMEFDGAQFYLTDGASVRRTIATGSSAGTIDNASIINSIGNITMTPTGSVIVSATTASMNSQTGALVVKGGVGIAGDLNVSGAITTTSNLNVSGANSDLRSSSDGNNGALRLFSQDGLLRMSLYTSSSYARMESYNSTPLRFATSGTDVMSITAAGNVGIGTTNPASQLEVSGTTSSNGQFRISTSRNVSASSSLFMRFNDINGSAAYLGFGGTSNQFNIQNYKPGAVTVATNDVERMRIDANGNVGIGITSPSQYLQVSGAVRADGRMYVTGDSSNVMGVPTIALRYDTAGNYGEIFARDYGTASQRPLIFQSGGGNVGVGTTNPISQLHVGGLNRTLSLAGSVAPQGSASYLLMGNSDSAGVSGPTILLSANRATQFGVGDSFSSPTGGNFTSYMTINHLGNVGIGATNPVAKLDIVGTRQNTISPTNSIFKFGGGDVHLYGGAHDGVGAPYPIMLQAMRSSDSQVFPLVVNPNGGNVGIGTLSPQATLDLGTTTSGARTSILARGADVNFQLGSINGSVANISGNIMAKFGLTYSGVENALINFHRGGMSTGGFMSFSTNSGTERMRIDTAGNVGIGTSAPTSRLNVVQTNAAAITATSGDNSSHVNIGIGRAVVEGRLAIASGGGSYATGSAAGDLILRVDDSTKKIHFSAGTTEAMTIVSGSVGIGTATPGSKLQVGASIHGGLTATIAGTPGAPATTGANQLNGNLRLSANTANSSILDMGIYNALPYGAWFQAQNGGDFSDHANYPLVFQPNGGNVGIGMANPSYKLDVSGTIRGFGITDSSDIRLKKEIKPIESSLGKILQISGVTYYWKDPAMPKKQIGFVAQQLEKIFPELVETDNSGMKSVNYSHLVAPLVEAVKTLYQRLSSVEAQNIVQDQQLALQARKMAALEAKSDKLEAENAALKAYLCDKDPAAKICK